MENKHFESCEAPICLADTTDNAKKDVVWIVGEAICGKSPMTHVQKMQRRINKRIEKKTYKNVGMYFTAAMLENISQVRNGTKGKSLA